MNDSENTQQEITTPVAPSDQVAEKAAEVPAELLAVVDTSAEEKLTLVETELDYLKAVMETQRLQKIIEEKAKAYPAIVDSLLKKYGLDKSKYTFDATSKSFRKI
jgi:hypothetical protein